VRDRRQGRTILVVLAIITAAALFVFLGQIFAQDEMPPEPAPGMEPGGPGGPEAGMMLEPGMMGGAGMGMGMGGRGGAPLQWALIPDVYLEDDEGNPREYTVNQWQQLQRIYQSRRITEAGAAEVGRPGYGLATRITREMAVKQKELDAVRYLYEFGLDSFTFEIGCRWA